MASSPASSSVVLEPLLSITDVAKILSCSRRLVERMLASGKFPASDVRVGRMPRWERETVARWIADSKKHRS